MKYNNMENNNIDSQNQEHYSTDRKVVDYLIGFFGFCAVEFIVFYIIGLIIRYFPAFFYLFFIFIPVFFIFVFSFSAKAIKPKRKYISKGITFAAILNIIFPVLILGACSSALFIR